MLKFIAYYLQSQLSPHLHTSVHSIFAFKHLHLPRQPFSTEQPHLSSYSHVSEVCDNTDNSGFYSLGGPSFHPSQMDLVFPVMEQDFTPSKILSGMPHVLYFDLDQYVLV